MTRFQPGDRVAEKPKVINLFAASQITRDQIRQSMAQRYGTVLETIYKANKSGAKVPYVSVMWDGRQSPSVHSQSRLCSEHE